MGQPGPKIQDFLAKKLGKNRITVPQVSHAKETSITNYQTIQVASNFFSLSAHADIHRRSTRRRL